MKTCDLLDTSSDSPTLSLQTYVWHSKLWSWSVNKSGCSNIPIGELWLKDASKINSRHKHCKQTLWDTALSLNDVFYSLNKRLLLASAWPPFLFWSFQWGTTATNTNGPLNWPSDGAAGKWKRLSSHWWDDFTQSLPCSKKKKTKTGRSQTLLLAQFSLTTRKNTNPSVWKHEEKVLMEQSLQKMKKKKLKNKHNSLICRKKSLEWILLCKKKKKPCTSSKFYKICSKSI